MVTQEKINSVLVYAILTLPISQVQKHLNQTATRQEQKQVLPVIQPVLIAVKIA